MKVFISVLVLILSFQPFTKADNIQDFDIEGMSIGDSLLDFMTKKEINKNILDYFPDERKYYVVGKTSDLNTYEQIEIYLKTDDKNYIIRTLGAFIEFSGKECLLMKREIDEEFKQIFSNLKSYPATLKHPYDKSGKSKQIQTNYVFGDSAHKDDHIRTECTSWSEEIKQKDGFTDNLIVIAMTSEILKWIDGGYK